MALETGTRVGIYEVTGKLGEGGMGEVYRAHDTTLDRDVALKVLSEAFTADADRLSRFQREAKVLASLNHPNIGAIHGLESAGETQALVLELIEGPTLADRIAEGPLPVEEALSIAGQIADAVFRQRAGGDLPSVQSLQELGYGFPVRAKAHFLVEEKTPVLGQG